MISETHSILHEVQDTDLQVVNIASLVASKSVFWRLADIKPSSFLHHVPFLFWLVETARPGCVVQLGLEQGGAYFAACQAVDKLNLEARCHGLNGYDLETDVSKKKRGFAALERLNADRYSDFSRLSQEDPELILRRLPQKGIDLIIVDGALDERGLALLETDWLGMLSSNGILLLHGFDTHFAQGPARAFVDRLMDLYPAILMEGGDGLLAVLCGGAGAADLRLLAGLQAGDKGYGEIRQAFARLGTGLYFEALSGAQYQQIQQLETALSESRAVVQHKDEQKRRDAENSQLALAEAEHRVGEGLVALTRRCEHYANAQAQAGQLERDLRQQLEQAEQDGQEAAAHVEALLQSSSWRITRPIRWLMRRLRRA